VCASLADTRMYNHAPQYHAVQSSNFLRVIESESSTIKNKCAVNCRSLLARSAVFFRGAGLRLQISGRDA